jgi:hypothetical protein
LRLPQRRNRRLRSHTLNLPLIQLKLRVIEFRIGHLLLFSAPPGKVTTGATINLPAFIYRGFKDLIGLI